MGAQAVCIVPCFEYCDFLVDPASRTEHSASRLTIKILAGMNDGAIDVCLYRHEGLTSLITNN